jgi:hypothetical protein
MVRAAPPVMRTLKRILAGLAVAAFASSCYVETRTPYYHHYHHYHYYYDYR